MQIHDILRTLVRGESLDRECVAQVFTALMTGELTPSQIGALLGMMATRPPTVDELVGAAQVMRNVCVKIHHDFPILLDTCGTGGDHAGTFNISTCTAFVVAAAGVPVAKHGNRSATSQCGGADLLEAMGWNLEVEPERLEACLKQTGFTFLFARKMHPAMRHVAPVRSELGIRTIFNFLGPMSNPAGTKYQLVGIPDAALLETYAQGLAELGAEAAMVVCSRDGLDEISLSAPTDAVLWRDGSLSRMTINPEALGLPLCAKKELEGGTVETNVQITEALLRDKVSGPKHHAVVLNAGAALYVAGKCQTIAAGIELAKTTIANGAAWDKVQEVMNAIAG